MAKTNAKTNVIIAASMGVIVLLLSVFFISSYFYNWDVGQFALGMENYDISMHQPHPPGYPIFVGIAIGLDSLLNNANLSLSIISLIFAILAGAFFYLLAHAVTKDTSVSAMAAIFFITNPIFWFYREVGLTYTADALAGILIAWCAVKIIFNRNYTFFLLQLAVLGLFAGVRPSLISLMLPLVILSAIFVRGKKFFLWGLLILAVSIGAWLIPTAMMSGGIMEYYETTTTLFSVSAEGTSILAGAPWEATWGQIKTFTGVMAAGLIMLAIPLIITAILLLRSKDIYKKIREKNKNFGLINFTLIFLAWVVPAIFIYAFIHFGQPGYVLLIIPAFCLIAVLGMFYLLQKRWGYLLLVFLIIIQVLIFILLTPFATSPTNLSKAEIYEVYLEKINPWFLKFNYTVINENDEKFALLDEEINEYLNSQDTTLEETVIIMPRNLFYEEDGFELRNDEIFRQVMAYYPEAIVIEVAPDRDYWIEGHENITTHHFDKEVIIPAERRHIIFIANKIEEKDYPVGISLNRDREDRIYSGDAIDITEFEFATFKFKKN
ncbi:hypothetical protein KKC88_03780 [Patescibacteria group bacterium]|nr:hypothetical protein [Patescibacteria group bacterium]MBU1673383.1 hypothetical protein [Patescibacteria group bacterium]MBU1963449.1 hypothetical protein [Patescibacteria group bacterium]